MADPRAWRLPGLLNAGLVLCDRARPASFWVASSLFQNPQSLIDLLLQLRLTPNREQQARARVSRGRHDVSLGRPVYSSRSAALTMTWTTKGRSLPGTLASPLVTY